MTIPIRNLYYLFAYAWNLFPDGSSTPAGIEDCPDLKNLFARLLVSGANRLIRRGIDRGYVAMTETTRAPRGRILMDEVLKTQSLRRGEVICSFDELTPDVAHNQILKATARLLARTEGMAPPLRHELRLLIQRLEAVSDVRLSRQAFRRVQLSRNTRQYLPLLRLCEFVFRNELPTEDGQASSFAEALQDELAMSSIFEAFLRNFYAFEQRTFSVKREIMRWRGKSLQPADWGLMPVMETDLTLRSASRVIVMDAKFYKDPLARNQMGRRKHHASNLYQLLTYLAHAQDTAAGASVEGALVYASAGEPFSMTYELRGHPVRLVALDLERPWRAIHEELLDLVGAGSEVRAA